MIAVSQPKKEQDESPLGTPLLELWLPPDPQAVPEARRQAGRVCTEIGIPDEDCFTLDLALGEALANAVIHGAPHVGPYEQTGHVLLSLWNYDGHLIVQVQDHGPGFDPPPPPYQMPPASAQDTHGRGLPLMEMLTDALVVCRGDAREGGASIYLIKSIGQPSRN